MNKIYLTSTSNFLKCLLFLVLITGVEKGWGQTTGDFQPKNATGNWSDFNAWNRHNGTAFVAATIGQIPTNTSDIYFIASKNISVDITTALCNNIILSTSGTTEKITLNPSAILSVYGSLLQNSNSNIPFPSFGANSKIIFRGSANQTITNSGGNTNLNNVEINKNGGTFTLPGVNTKYDIFTLTAGALVCTSGACLVGLSTSSTVIVNGGTWTQILGANRINGGNGGTDVGLVINNGTMTLATTSGGVAGFNFSSINISNNGILNLNASSGNLNITNTFSLDATSTINTTYTTTPSAINNIFLGTFNYTNTGSQNIINTSYGNLGLSGSGNKIPFATLNIIKNLTIFGSAILPLSPIIGINIGGDWSNYSTGAFTESTSTVNFNGLSSQIINTIGGEDFFKLNKTGSGTLTLNSDVRFAGTSSELNISAGVLDAGIYTLSGSSTSLLTMSGGTLKLAKLATILPEFATPTGYTLTGGSTIELNGVGNQDLRGAKDYRNISFSNSGIKTMSSSPSSITGTVTISNNAILDAANNSMGGVGTNIVMNGNSFYKTAGTGTKPDAQGTYLLGIGTTIEFTNTSVTPQVIRLSPSYFNIIVSGSSVANSSLSSTPLNIQTSGSFTVTGSGIFKHANANGFSGASNTAISTNNSPSINLQVGSTIEYYRADGAAQNITNVANVGLGTSHYYNLTLSGTGSKIAPSSTLSINGNFNKTTASTFFNNNGTISFDGNSATTQTYNCVAPIIEFYKFINNNTNAGLTINGDLGIEESMNLNSASTLILGSGNINLRSSLNKTASVNELNSNVIINYPSAGRFIIERFIPPGRKWRFLAVPATTTQKVREAWMENAANIGSNPKPGYGTIVTDEKTTALANGFDAQSISGPSLKFFSGITNNYTGINSPADLVNSQPAYMAFVRGDRSCLPSNSAISNTVLRTTGQLKTQLQTTNGIPVGEFVAIGNPYASRINLKSIYAASSISPNIYVWDPKLTGSYGLGGFQTLSYFDATNGFIIVPGGGSYPVGGPGVFMNTIESGQAFFVRAGASVGAININETDKTVGSTNVFGRVGEMQPPAMLGISLHLIDAAANSNLLDGVAVLFNENENNEVDYNDAKKLTNTSENVSIKKVTKLLAIERKQFPINNDTIQLNITGLRIANYQWKLNLDNINAEGRDVIFIDRFLQTSTILNLLQNNFIHFNVTNEAASYAANRFLIVFKQTPAPIFVQVNAAATNNKQIAINWAVANENVVANYSIERSKNNIDFVNIQTTPALQNNSNTAFYTTIDAAPLVSDNYYRIKLTTLAGNILYSNMVKVNKLNDNIGLSLSPTILTNSEINIVFQNQPMGTYNYSILNNLGQSIQNGEMKVNGFEEVKKVQLYNLAKGLYNFVVSGANNKKSTLKFTIL